MKKMLLALSITTIVAGGAFASSLEDSDISNTVGMENSKVVQYGTKNSANLGTEIENSRVVNSSINNEVYMKNAEIRQGGTENYVNTGTKVDQ